MKIAHPELAHATSLDEAEALQLDVRERVHLRPLAHAPHRVAGCDAAYSRDGLLGYGATAVLHTETLRRIEVQTARAACRFPYVPGLFSFRELPVLLESIKLLTEPPDLILVEGHGIAHPRRAGMASHLGVLLDLPTIGCAKTPLGGDWSEPADAAGSWSEVRMDGEIVGAAYRHRAHRAPIFVSPGHLVDMASIRDLLPALFGDHRLPEPLALAHQAANKARAHH